MQIYDYIRQAKIAKVDKPLKAPHQDICPCRLTWQDEAVRHARRGGYGFTPVETLIFFGAVAEPHGSLGRRREDGDDPHRSSGRVSTSPTAASTAAGAAYCARYWSTPRRRWTGIRRACRRSLWCAIPAIAVCPCPRQYSRPHLPPLSLKHARSVATPMAEPPLFSLARVLDRFRHPQA